MGRFLMVGRWLQVLVAVLGWLLLVPVFEFARNVFGGLVGHKQEGALGRERPSRSRHPHLAEERRPAA